VQLDIGGHAEPDEREEFRLLALAAGAEVVGTLGGSRAVPDPRLFIGTGKADELKSLVAATETELVIFNHPLSPAQERNLERLLQCRVVDRAGLILDIFAQRARSFEGKLQVELAQLKHLSTRLVRGWTHLERQKGGIGLRGPGETQLETDRRLLAKRVDVLDRRLERIESQRAQGRKARAKAELPVISLVGYTNAGKSTLFNRADRGRRLSGRSSCSRRWIRPCAVCSPAERLGEGLVADTVGFVSRLPHELVNGLSLDPGRDPQCSPAAACDRCRSASSRASDGRCRNRPGRDRQRRTAAPGDLQQDRSARRRIAASGAQRRGTAGAGLAVGAERRRDRSAVAGAGRADRR
jgi:GTPase